MRLHTKVRINHQRADKADSFLSWGKINTKKLRLGCINIKQENCPPWKKVGPKENTPSRQRLLLAEVAAWIFKSWGVSDLLINGHELA